MRWRCPRCLTRLDPRDEALHCDRCRADFPVVGGVADLRHPDYLGDDHLADRERARALAAEGERRDVTEVIAAMFRRPDIWTAEIEEHRTRRTLGAPQALRADVRGWLAAAIPKRGVFLDVGCGLGTLIAAAALEGRSGIGIDQSLHLLVAANRLIAAHGGRPVLAAAFAEHLPLAAAAVHGVTMQDVLEHVDSKRATLAEAERVLVPGAALAVVVPNRFSLAAEPHVGIWGVGWLPRRWQRRYVALRTHNPYEHTALPSVSEAVRLLRETRFEWTFSPTPIPDDEVAHFGRRRTVLAHAYNALLANPPGRAFGIWLGPSFRIVATRA